MEGVEEGAGGSVFTSAINRIVIQQHATVVGKFDLWWSINNTAETRFNYLQYDIRPWRINDHFNDHRRGIEMAFTMLLKYPMICRDGGYMCRRYCFKDADISDIIKNG